jgi:hypothetical protein
MFPRLPVAVYSYNLRYTGVIFTSIWPKTIPGQKKSETLSEKLLKPKRLGSMAVVVGVPA